MKLTLPLLACIAAFSFQAHAQSVDQWQDLQEPLNKTAFELGRERMLKMVQAEIAQEQQHLKDIDSLLSSPEMKKCDTTQTEACDIAFHEMLHLDDSVISLDNDHQAKMEIRALMRALDIRFNSHHITAEQKADRVQMMDLVEMANARSFSAYPLPLAADLSSSKLPSDDIRAEAAAQKANIQWIMDVDAKFIAAVKAK